MINTAELALKARKIIAEAVEGHTDGTAAGTARIAMKALTDAGWSIVPPLELHHAADSHGDVTWEALYVDGELEMTGEPYHALESVAAMTGVRHRGEGYVHDGHVGTAEDGRDFMLGSGGMGKVAQTLTEVDEYRRARLAREATAASNRERAVQLLKLAQTDDSDRERLGDALAEVLADLPDGFVVELARRLPAKVSKLKDERESDG
jgi:hypothetical protein